jgi:hypothetical protein
VPGAKTSRIAVANVKSKIGHHINWPASPCKKLNKRTCDTDKPSMTHLFKFVCDCHLCRAQWTKILVLSQYLPKDVVNEILELTLAIDRRVDTLSTDEINTLGYILLNLHYESEEHRRAHNDKESGLFWQHRRSFHVCDGLPLKSIETLSMLGLLVAEHYINRRSTRIDDKVTSLFSLHAVKRKSIIDDISFGIRPPDCIVPLITLLGTEVRYYHRFYEVWKIGQRLIYDGCREFYEFDGVQYNRVDVVKELLKQSLLQWQNVCAHCFDVRVNALPACAKCFKTAYCCRECQLKDWPSHKLACSGRVNS